MPRTKVGENVRAIMVYMTKEQIDALDLFMDKIGQHNRSHILNHIIGEFLGKTFFVEIWEQEDGHFVALPAGTQKPSPELLRKIGAPASHLLGIVELEKYGMTYKDLETLLRTGFLPNECLRHIIEHQE
jgi:hypothetical protein